MQTIKFPCPFCGRRMGVAAELLGRKVRCPHCSQVVLAPATAPDTSPTLPQRPAPAPAAVEPVAPAPVDPAHPFLADLPSFNIAPKEAPDSIFGESEDDGDEVFATPNDDRFRKPELPPPLDDLAPPCPRRPCRSSRRR